MLDHLISEYHLHPIVDHFTIALLAFGVAAEFLAAAATLLSRGGTGWLPVWSQKLRSTSLLLMTGGAIAAVPVATDPATASIAVRTASHPIRIALTAASTLRDDASS